MPDADTTTRTRPGIETGAQPWDAGAWRVRRRDDEQWALLTLAPAIAVYLIAWILPMAFAAYVSLYDVPLTSRDWTFIGIENYRTVVSLGAFWASLWRGIVFAFGSTITQVGVGVWLALVINRAREREWVGERILATLTITTFLVPTVVLAILTLFWFDLFVGLFHVIGSKWLGLWDYRDYLIMKRGGWAMGVVILVNSWKYSGFVALFTLAQRRSIPEHFYDAAKVAGATTWQMFRDITLPRIKGIVALIALFRFVFSFNQFDVIRMLTGGGPGSETTTLPILAYGISFGLGEYGLGNALAVVMFLVLLLASVLYFVVVRPSEEVETEV